MKKIILSVGLVVILGVSLGCNGDNNVSAQDQDPGPTTSSSMTMASGNVIDPGMECDGMLSGFDVGDSVSVNLTESDDDTNLSGMVENNTKGTSAECNPNEVLFDGPPLSGMVCMSESSTISSLADGDFMSILISYTWKDNFLENVDKSITIIAADIGAMTNTKSVPCARVKIESLTVTK